MQSWAVAAAVGMRCEACGVARWTTVDGGRLAAAMAGKLMQSPGETEQCGWQLTRNVWLTGDSLAGG